MHVSRASTWRRSLRYGVRLAFVLLACLGVALAASNGGPPATASHGDPWHTIERTSVASDGTQANFHSDSVAISADGRFIAFTSSASNLIAGEVNGAGGIFVRDRLTPTTVRVSVSSSGDAGNSGSFYPAISADGRFVAFASDATNLVPNDANGLRDVFVHDRQTGTTTRVSVDSAGGEANLPSCFIPAARPNCVALSADGRYVVFDSSATNLVTTGDTNGGPDIFVHDRRAGVTSKVSALVDPAAGGSYGPAISGDGRLVTFTTHDVNVIGSGPPGVAVHDRQSGETTLISGTVDAPADGGSDDGEISADGLFVTFVSRASNLVVGDTNTCVSYPLAGNCPDIFVYDRQTATTTRVSIASDGAQADNPSYRPAINADGRFVTFASEASNLVPGDTQTCGVPLRSCVDIFVHDRQTGATHRVSVDTAGNQANADSCAVIDFSVDNCVAISGDGSKVAFQSSASNLVAADSNNFLDVFLATSAQADLTITKSDSPDPVPNRGTVIYTLKVSNAGSLSATAFKVVDTLPSRALFLGIGSTKGTCSERRGIVICSLASLATGEVVTITISVRLNVPNGGTLTNTAVVDQDNTVNESDEANNTVSITTTVLP